MENKTETVGIEAFKELDFSYYMGGNAIFTIYLYIYIYRLYTHSGNLIPVL